MAGTNSLTNPQISTTTKPATHVGHNLYRAVLAVFNNGPEQSTVRTTQLTNNNPNTNQEDSNNVPNL
jgi:hypothetical protein